MPNQPTDKNQKAVLEKTGRRMSNPSDEKPQRTAGTEEEQLSGKIEKVTESLLSQWEISEDDFEDTQDLTETAAHISRQIAPGASNKNAAGSIRREEAEPRSQATPHSQTVSRSQTTPHSQSEPRSQAAPRGEAAVPRGDAGEKRSGMEGGRRTEGTNRPESRQPATERTGERKVSSNRPEIETRRPEAGKTADKRNTSAERSRQKSQTDTRESRRQDPAEKRQQVKRDSGKDAASRPPRSERYESRQGSQTPRMADSERPNRTSSAAMAARNGAERSANSKTVAAGPEKARGLWNTEELKGKNIYAVHSRIGMPENAVPVRMTTGTRKLKYARPMRKNVPSRLPVKAGTMQKIPLPGIPAEKAYPIKNRKILWWNFGTACIQWTK